MTFNVSLRLAGTIFAASLLFVSCEKSSGPAGAVGPAGPKLKGSMAGFTTLYDQYGRQLPAVGGIQVSIDGTNHSTTTDANGHWQLDTVSTGNYTISLSKTGYGSAKMQGISFIGGGNAEYVKNGYMSSRPDFEVSSLTLTDTTVNGTAYVLFRGKLNKPDTRTRTVVFYAGKSSNVSAAPSDYVVVLVQNIPSQNGASFFIPIMLDDIHVAGFSTGSTLNIAAYGGATSFQTSSYYQDPVTGRSVYNAISNNAVKASITVK